MGVLKNPPPVTLFLAALYAPAFTDEQITALVENIFGRAVMQTPAYEFSFSDYYLGEMGPNLRKCFYVLERLIDPAEIVDWKLRALEVEAQHSAGGKRTINLDPGYLEAPKLVLATTKNFAHRIYLGRGVFADVQLYVRNGKFQVYPWTYPDYRTAEHLSFFERAREFYLDKTAGLRVTHHPLQRMDLDQRID